jgi:hypothetical protein
VLSAVVQDLACASNGAVFPAPALSPQLARPVQQVQMHAVRSSHGCAAGSTASSSCQHTCQICHYVYTCALTLPLPLPLLLLPTHTVVPAGFYLKSPGVAVPCPQGEFKVGVGSDGACTKCGPGVSTAAEAATSPRECKVVTPGYYASRFNSDGSVNTTSICPQSFYCPGGNQTAAAATGRRLAQLSTAVVPAGTGLVACPYGSWTKAVGASTVEECLTPPGHFTDLTAKTTQLCPAHSYRANWLPPEQAEAQACIPCGVAVLAEKTDRVTRSYPNGTDVEVAVTSSADDCCKRHTLPACACNRHGAHCCMLFGIEHCRSDCRDSRVLRLLLCCPVLPCRHPTRCGALL